MFGQINSEAHNIKHLIQSGTIGAEIGVWYGNTSEMFMEVGLRELHLVDSWSVTPYNKETNEHGSYEKYLKRYASITGGETPEDFNKYYSKVYQSVVNKFVLKSEVKIHRMLSEKWFKTISDDYLDWIYVDGDHSYEGCLEDLNNSLRVVKSGGIIIGDDYKWPGQNSGKPGVTKALDEFCESNNLTLRPHGLNSQWSILV